MLSRRRISLLLATSGLIAVLAPGLAACSGDGPDRAAVAAKIRSDPRMQGTPDPVVECLTDWYLTETTEQKRKAFVEGDTSAENADAEQQTAVLECLKQAA